MVNFVFQVEFMAKHPILSMFHDDGYFPSSLFTFIQYSYLLIFSLFLSICNSERAAEAIVQSSETGWPVIELRFNSIRIDYSAISAQQGSNRTIRLQPCAVRVDIYNGLFDLIFSKLYLRFLIKAEQTNYKIEHLIQVF